jgi:hypothetical protein
MRRVELKSLLPAGTVSDRSTSEVLHDVASVSAGASTSFSEGTNMSGAGNSSGARVGTDLGNQLQGSANNVASQLTQLISQISTLNSTEETQIGVTQDNTQALTENSTSRSSGSPVGGTIANVASSVLGGGLSLSPIIGGLMSLFSGSGTQTLAAPAPFRLPVPVESNAGITSGSPGQAMPVSYDGGGQPRVQASSPAPQVTVQVNAMDSQSFLDHSAEIASAVRQALLSSNSLSDVISDL